MSLPVIAVTPGEPAGIGPDLVITLAQDEQPCRLVAVADPELLHERAHRLGIGLSLEPWSGQAHRPGHLAVVPLQRAAPTRPGALDPANAAYVLDTIRRAAEGCLGGEFDALVTGPIQKSVINDAGIPFTGHTEFLAAVAGVERVVMLLAAGSLRVALATTHLPLREVSDHITIPLLFEVLEILHRELCRRFAIERPRIGVCGLNPHAGEAGHLGREEIDIIIPVLDELHQRGWLLDGPLPADTIFVPDRLATLDAVLAMYHDQGLPVLKHVGFGHAVNVTLGLPFIRTSVDHGTALDLAATGKASGGSLAAAVKMAMAMATNERRSRGDQVAVT